MVLDSPKLSICIATHNRGHHLCESLDSIIGQLVTGVELVVVDGASPDNTRDVMEGYVALHPEISYYREDTNSGVDRDYDKAVDYAIGEYCWLMTDDDLLRPDAVQRVLSAIEVGEGLIIVNAEVRNLDLSERLEEKLLKVHADEQYSADDYERFFIENARYTSFIGCVVIRRDVWRSRDRTSYYGTRFSHVGVIFQQPPIKHVRVIAETLIIIRLGNAMWAPQSFNIWMFKWPALIWGFSHYSEIAKQKVCSREPWRSMKTVFFYRAKGEYSTSDFHTLPSMHLSVYQRIGLYAISIFPHAFANVLAVLYAAIRGETYRLGLDSLLRSPHASTFSRLIARSLIK